MSSDTRLAVVIFAVLALCIAVPWAMWRVHEANRPVLLDARVVTATAADPVYRDGSRHLAPDEAVEIAVAVKIGSHDGSSRWLAPGDELQLIGETVGELVVGDWPEEDRRLRVFWFTVESSFLGGELARESCAKQLTYRSFLAPELGQDVRAEGFPDRHNDDHLGKPDGLIPVVAGTTRLYARVELIKGSGQGKAEQAVSTLGVERLGDPALPTLLRGGSFPAPINAVAGETFGLPGFEPVGDTEETRNEVTRDAFGASFIELVERRLVVSSASFAGLAVTGTPILDESRFAAGITVAAEGVQIRRGDRPLSWGDDVRAGDLLQVGRRWIVLNADDGNGLLDRADAALMCWKGPPMAVRLADALGPAPGEVVLLCQTRSP